MQFKKIQDVEKTIYQRLIVKEGQPIIISIDGKNGSGKSLLALCLCCQNEKFIYFDIDTHYWHSKRLPYVENINYEMLERNICNAISNNEVVVIDGVCLLAILEKISLKSTLSIYVKKTDDDGRWLDGIKFDYDLCPEEVLIEENQAFHRWAEMEGGDLGKYIESDLSLDVLRYHLKYKPDKKADIIYERTSIMGA